MELEIAIDMSLSSRQEHADAARRTGYWGKRAASALMLSKEYGTILLCKRGPTVMDKNQWAGVSGAIDRGEGPKRAILREIQEELGYNMKPYLIELPTFVDGTFKCYNFFAVCPEEFTPTLNYENTKAVWTRGLFDIPNKKPLHKGIQWLLENHIVELYAAIDNVLATRKDIVHNPYRHGHIRPAPDGLKARCGSSRMCAQCKVEKKAVELGLVK